MVLLKGKVPGRLQNIKKQWLFLVMFFVVVSLTYLQALMFASISGSYLKQDLMLTKLSWPIKGTQSQLWNIRAVALCPPTVIWNESSVKAFGLVRITEYLKDKKLSCCH